VQVELCDANQGTHGAPLVRRCGAGHMVWDALQVRRARRRSRDAEGGAERKRGVRRRIARGRRFLRWKECLPGCNQGRGT
jgi:hypothetical protein